MEIIAMGGGGFSMEPDNPLLDRYILQQVKKKRPKICFLPTASGDAAGYIERFYRFFEQEECEPTHLSLLKPIMSEEEMKDFLLAQDIIYVGGGNTRNMLALWREWGIDQVLREAWENNIILAGISAGAICWFEQAVTDSNPRELTVISGLGLLKGSSCPHFDGEIERRPSYYRLLREGTVTNGVALDDGAALHFVGTNVYRAVSSRPQATAYCIEVNGSDIVEKPFNMQHLGCKEPE
ncbi:Type 1 glutamine amidotransferase-like domain-containing protein [Microbacteriaceae bacterium 4G12]